jgi:hypothetical protein
MYHEGFPMRSHGLVLHDKHLVCIIYIVVTLSPLLVVMAIEH